MIEGFDWESLFDSQAPAGCRLSALLLTCYDRPDERFLIEHFLPMLFGLAHNPHGEGLERERFFVELTNALAALRGSAWVISSMPTPGAEVGGRNFGWLWRFLSLHHVGRSAKQHAKLWMFHWSASDTSGSEYLELVISSANLTASAFRDQIQAAWRCVLPLQTTASKANLNSWGLIPQFLQRLGEAVATNDFVKRFTSLLGRCQAPPDVDFIASVPGRHSKQELKKTAWGVAGLRGIMPPGKGYIKLRVMAPFIGSWTEKSLNAWCEHAESAPDKLELLWIEKLHPWAGNNLDGTPRWVLPPSTLQCFITSNIGLLRLEPQIDKENQGTSFHQSHHPQHDGRWSHAKLYLLRRGTTRRLLVTSANFSSSAWGIPHTDGSLGIRNFELGVFLRQLEWPTAEPVEFLDVSDAWVVKRPVSAEAGLLEWAQANFDGTQLVVECRFNGNPNGELVARVCVAGKTLDLKKWQKSGNLWRITMDLPDGQEVPASVQLIEGGLVLEIPTQDLRDPATIPLPDIPEVDPSRAQALRDELLLEAYGGVFEDAPNDSPVPGIEEPDQDQVDDMERMVSSADSYAVPAVVEARKMMACVDGWVKRMNAALSRADTGEQKRLRQDGTALVDVFERRTKRRRQIGMGSLAIGSKMASQELEVRLQGFNEEGAVNE